MSYSLTCCEDGNECHGCCETSDGANRPFKAEIIEEANIKSRSHGVHSQIQSHELTTTAASSLRAAPDQW